MGGGAYGGGSGGGRLRGGRPVKLGWEERKAAQKCLHYVGIFVLVFFSIFKNHDKVSILKLRV